MGTENVGPCERVLVLFVLTRRLVVDFEDIVQMGVNFIEVQIILKEV